MIKIGITGGIGSGKTLVSRVFEHFGVPIYNADEESKKIMRNNEDLRNALTDAFGDKIFNKNEINKLYFSDLIFNNANSLKKANSIIHPFVRRDFEQWVQHKHNCKYIIQEAAILFESGAYKLLDRIILVYAPKTLRIQRVVKRDGINEAAVEMRIRNQLCDDEKKKIADYIIYNDDKQLVIPQILKIHKQLKEY